jgi:SAM-dependent methyltransferase
MNQEKIGYGSMVVGTICLALVAVLALFPRSADMTPVYVFAVLSCLFYVFGVYLTCGVALFEHVQVNKTGIDITFFQVEKVQPKVLPPEEKRKRQEYAHNNPPPAASAPPFNALTDVPDMAVIPGTDSTIPMYMLDKNFRILDWNEAFSLAFDRTMEGRRGQSAIEWVYFLDNFTEVLDHANRTFHDLDRLPQFDKEELRFTSVRYNRLSATKRAYQFQDDSGTYAGWLIVLDLRFDEPDKEEQYRFDLIKALQRTLLWTDYSLSYDQVLNSVPLYDELLNKMLGEAGSLKALAADARVLDLGAGTGNLALRLANGQRIVFSIENSRTMLKLLQAKCKAHLRRDNQGPGIIALKQDVSSLYGLPRNYFDAMLANNVFYSLPNPEEVLKEVARLLRPGGEVRVSGPAKGFDIERLFRRFKKDLEAAGQFTDAMKVHFERARWINSMLVNDLRAWSERDHGQLFGEAELEYNPEKDTPYYGGHGVIKVARKPS